MPPGKSCTWTSSRAFVAAEMRATGRGRTEPTVPRQARIDFHEEKHSESPLLVHPVVSSTGSTFA